MPDDPIDPYEQRLARRVEAYTDQAVQPIDAGEIARTVAAGARRRTVAGRLFGPSSPSRGLALVAVAALIGLVAIGVSIGAGGKGVFTPSSTPGAAPAAVRRCTPSDVDAVITAWDGAAGSRIATVELRQIGASACVVDPQPQPWLADGHGDALITGKAGTGTPIEIAPGQVLHTLVQVSNYCGADPAAPVTIAFTQRDALFVATALSPTDVSGVPPCSGQTAPAAIEMHPWSR